jgi:hypothetical protein
VLALIEPIGDLLDPVCLPHEYDAPTSSYTQELRDLSIKSEADLAELLKVVNEAFHEEIKNRTLGLGLVPLGK